MAADDENNANIKVSAHVLVQLGEELVTDVEQAILECVKNAYDADAPGCRIEVRTHAEGTISHQGTVSRLAKFQRPSENVSVDFQDAQNNEIKFKDGIPTTPIDPCDTITRNLQWKGSIIVEDKGDGFDADAIRNSWLVISSSSKRSSGGGKKEKTKLGRTPLGDKGVGRLGSMKLGDILLVESAQQPTSTINSALFRWADCEVSNTVDEIPVRMLENVPNSDLFKGTRVSVLGLRDTNTWASATRALEITKSLARLISPFEAKSNFPVIVDVDGHKASLVAVTDTLLSRAIAEFEFFWEVPDKDSGQPILRCEARFRERLFRPKGGKDSQIRKVKAVFGDDEGVGFLQWLPTYKKLTMFETHVRPSREWFVELRQNFSWDKIVPTDGPQTIEPGSFAGAFYYFHVKDTSSDDNDEKAEALADSDNESAAGIGIDRKMIKEMAGISILRDGFRVRSQGDWLNVSEGMTSGSTYQLRFNNTLGYFALSGEHNYRLVEKSDREGFVENAEFRGFMAIAETCKYFANEAIENVRRAQDQYADLKQKASSDDTPSTPEKSLSVMQETLKLANSAQQGARSVVDNISSGIDLVEQQSGGIVNIETSKQAVTKLRSALAEAKAMQSKLQVGLKESVAVNVLRQEISDNKDQMLSLYESAAVGLSARGLAHELRTHLVEIRKRTTALEHLLKTGKYSETAVLPHLRAIKSSCGSISSAASLIDPMLPRTRAVKEPINLHAFIQEYVSHRQVALDKEEITFKLPPPGVDTIVRMNRGRLLQVLDNLVRNSVYWLRRGKTTMGIDRPKQISVQIRQNGFVLSDSGPGVDSAYEESLFEIFVTSKPAKERGQGLGLFIVTQLLAVDGCSIYLSPQRNKDGRRNKFEVDLSSVLTERKG